MKRKLDAKELAASLKGLERLKEELSYNEYQVNICELKLETGLEIEHKKNIRDYKKLKREFSDAVKMIRDNIAVLQGQIRNGVDVKKIKKEKEGKDE